MIFNFPAYMFQPTPVSVTLLSGGNGIIPNSALAQIVITAGAGSPRDITMAALINSVASLDWDMGGLDGAIAAKGPNPFTAGELRVKSGNVTDNSSGGSGTLTFSNNMSAGDGVHAETLTFSASGSSAQIFKFGLGYGVCDAGYTPGSNTLLPKTSLVLNGDVSVECDGFHSGTTTVSANSSLKLRSLTAVGVGAISVAGALDLAGNINFFVAATTSGSGSVTISGTVRVDGDLSSMYTPTVTGNLESTNNSANKILGPMTVTGSIAGGYSSQGTPLTVVGDLTLSGTLKVYQVQALNYVPGGGNVRVPGFVVGKVISTGALDVSGTSAVVFEPYGLIAGTYRILEGASITGTLPAPTLTGTGRTFGGYTYGSNYVDIILT